MQVLTDSNYKQVVAENTIVVADFYAEWCGPCKVVGPILEQLSNEYEGRVVIGKVNIDDNPNTTVAMGIRNVPTLLFYKNGELVDKQVGASAPNVLRSKIDNLL